MKKNFSMKIFFISILLINSLKVYSQIDENGGSVYSIFGLGEINYSAGIRTDAMGIMGISLGGNYVNTLNPASWTSLNFTVFSTKFSLENIRSTDGVQNSVRTYGNFESFNLLIPINKANGWVLGLGLNEMSKVNYDVMLQNSVLGENYTQYYSGNGGLSRLNIGMSYLLAKDISFGLQFNYIFGNISKKNEILFINPYLTDTRNTVINNIYGYNVSGGLTFNGFGKIFKSKNLEKLSLGIFFSSPAKYNSELNGRYSTGITVDSTTISDGKIEIPWSAAIGITNEFNPRFIMSADVLFQNWDKYKFYDVHPSEIKNSMRFGMGAEYTESKKIDDAYYKRISYRLGLSYTMDYLKINGVNINSFAVNAGLSLPIMGANALDLVFTYQRRGTTSNGLVRDNSFMFGAAVNISDLWFFKPKEEY